MINKSEIKRQFDDYWKNYVNVNKMTFSTPVLELAFREIAKNGFCAGYESGLNRGHEEGWDDCIKDFY